MTQDEIIRMAREAGYETTYLAYEPVGRSYQFLERFAALVAAHEREACAKEADYYAKNSTTARNITAAIRARGE